MFWRNFFIMSFILSPVFILFGMIIFSGKPKKPARFAKELPARDDPADRP